MHSVDDLNTFFNSEYPSVWIQTTDYFKGLELAIETQLSVDPDAKIYTLHPRNGLCLRDGVSWRPILHYYLDPMSGSGAFKKVYDISLAAEYVYDRNGVFLMPGDPQLVGKVGSYILHAFDGWRSKLFNNTNSEFMKFVFVGKLESDKIDPLISSLFWVIDQISLDVDAAKDLYTRIGANTPELVEPQSMPALVRQSTGFTENQALVSSLKSVKANDAITPDFIEEQRRKLIGESGVLQIVKPSISMAQIGGLQSAKDILEGGVWINQNPEEAAKLGLTPPNRILLIGVPGTGKSALCEATAHQLGYDMVKFGVSKMMSKWIGESESNMRAAFAQMNAMTPISIWIDELGRDFSGGHTSNDGGTTDRAHGELLSGLQELDRRNLLMAAANRIAGLPPEMLRADRFDKILFVGFPSAEERVAILKIYLPEGVPDSSVASLVGVTESYTGAEIKSAIAEARFDIGTKLHRPPNIQEIGEVLKHYRNRVWLRRRGEIVEMYRQAVDEWDWASEQQKAEAKSYASGRLPSQGSAKTKVTA